MFHNRAPGPPSFSFTPSFSPFFTPPIPHCSTTLSLLFPVLCEPCSHALPDFLQVYRIHKHAQKFPSLRAHSPCPLLLLLLPVVADWWRWFTPDLAAGQLISNNCTRSRVCWLSQVWMAINKVSNCCSSRFYSRLCGKKWLWCYKLQFFQYALRYKERP